MLPPDPNRLAHLLPQREVSHSAGAPWTLRLRWWWIERRLQAEEWRDALLLAWERWIRRGGKA